MPPDRILSHDHHDALPAIQGHYLQPKSPKKTASPATKQGKGAVRAKTGCYTCRIRRKKCDERADDQGACETCKRLHLECLGFGTKRPEWMKGGSLDNMRERIKDFLAAQGLIKGQSTMHRSQDPHPEQLQLSPGAPPPHTHSPTYSGRSVSVEERYQRAPESSVRYDYRQQIDPHLMEAAGPLTFHERAAYDAPYSERLVPMSAHSPTSSSDEPSSYVSYYGPQPHMYHHPQVQSYPMQHYPSLAKQSSFGTLYHGEIPDPNDLDDSNPTPMAGLSLFQQPELPSQENLVQYYMHSVVKIQYLLADPSVSDVILRFIRSSPLAHDAVCKLASLHQKPESRLHISFESDQDLQVLLSHTSSAVVPVRGKPDVGAALAALQIISCILFAGGRGPWRDWLDVACTCVSTLLEDPRFADPAEVLRNCDDMARFVIMTTMWFDVLAAVTLMHPPRFIKEYRIVFGGGASIDGHVSDGSEFCDMMNVMGCENRTVLALAEISALGSWKELEGRQGRLSMPYLVKKGQEIEQRLLPTRAAANAYMHANDKTSACRRTTAGVFRASAKVYLHSVLSGDSPACPEIKQAVQETIECFRGMPPHGKREIVRMTVFCICICGCLTDDPGQRQYLLGLLEEQAVDRVGNCEEVKNVMKTVWQRRDASRGRLVPWRDVMQGSLGGDKNRLLLLV